MRTPQDWYEAQPERTVTRGIVELPVRIASCGAYAQQRGLRRGMAVLSINHDDTTALSLREVDRLIKDAGRPLAMEFDARPVDIQDAEIRAKLESASSAAVKMQSVARSKLARTTVSARRDEKQRQAQLETQTKLETQSKSRWRLLFVASVVAGLFAAESQYGLHIMDLPLYIMEAYEDARPRRSGWTITTAYDAVFENCRPLYDNMQQSYGVSIHHLDGLTAQLRAALDVSQNATSFNGTMQLIGGPYRLILGTQDGRARLVLPELQAHKHPPPP